MQWHDDEDHDMARPARRASTGNAFRNHYKTSTKKMLAAKVVQLHFKTPAENAQHMMACTAEQCHWCRTMQFLERYKTAFQVVGDSLMNSPQHRGLNETGKVLANSMWLGSAHRGDGEIVLGCIPCRAMQDSRVATNPFASYQIPASRLFDATGRPHVLLRHAETTLHGKAVSKFLGIDTGAPRSGGVGGNNDTESE
jgi:hypothetical protein